MLKLDGHLTKSATKKGGSDWEKCVGSVEWPHFQRPENKKNLHLCKPMPAVHNDFLFDKKNPELFLTSPPRLHLFFKWRKKNCTILIWTIWTTSGLDCTSLTLVVGREKGEGERTAKKGDFPPFPLPLSQIDMSIILQRVLFTRAQFFSLIFFPTFSQRKKKDEGLFSHLVEVLTFKKEEKKNPSWWIQR